jgi:hypothetical protein
VRVSTPAAVVPSPTRQSRSRLGFPRAARPCTSRATRVPQWRARRPPLFQTHFATSAKARSAPQASRGETAHLHSLPKSESAPRERTHPTRTWLPASERACNSRVWFPTHERAATTPRRIASTTRVSPIARGTDRSPRLHHGTPCFPHPPLPSTDAVRAMRGAAPLCGATSPGYDACDEGHGGARFPRARREACRANPKTRRSP